MKTWWLSIFDTLRSSFWFVPSVLAVGGLALAAVLLTIDWFVNVSARDGFGWLDAGDTDAVRQLVATLLGAVITVMTVVFSVTVVALQLASTQFGPRLLRTFMQDRGTHLCLGAFIGTCVYCVGVLGVVGRFEREASVPHVATLGSLVLALASLGVLVYFIHHMARSIQAPEVIASVAEEVDRAIARWYPPEDDPCEVPDASADPPRPVDAARQVLTHYSNYVQAIDTEQLVRVASERELLLRLRCRAGDFIVEGEPLADIWPKEAVDDGIEREVLTAFMLGKQRTPTQDVEYAIDQLVEIAVRAMSPSVNDPFTAINCIDRLSNALSRLARCRMARPRYEDETGVVRVLGLATTYAGVVNSAFDKIRQTSRRDASVTIHQLDAIRVIVHHTMNDVQRDALRRQAEMIHRGTQEALPEPQDRRDADERYRRVLEALAAAGAARRDGEADRDPAELRA